MSNERTQRVTALANRLRMIQVELADRGPEERAGHLREELDRAVNGLAPAERRAFLESLETAFPAWDGQAAAISAPPQPRHGDPRELDDPRFLVNKLIGLSGRLSPQEKQEFAAKLAEVGLANTVTREITREITIEKPSEAPAPAPVAPAPAPAAAPLPPGEWPEPQATELWKKMGMDGKARPSTKRVLEILDLLVDFGTTLDQHIWAQWRAIAPNSTIRRGAPLQLELGRFNADDQRNQLTQEIGQLRKLIVSLIAATAQAGRFATKQFSKLAPHEIEVLERAKGGWGALEKRLWRCYCDLYAQMEGDAIENEIRRAFSDYVEALMRGPVAEKSNTDARPRP